MHRSVNQELLQRELRRDPACDRIAHRWLAVGMNAVGVDGGTHLDDRSRRDVWDVPVVRHIHRHEASRLACPHRRDDRHDLFAARAQPMQRKRYPGLRDPCRCALREARRAFHHVGPRRIPRTDIGGEREVLADVGVDRGGHQAVLADHVDHEGEVELIRDGAERADSPGDTRRGDDRPRVVEERLGEPLADLREQVVAGPAVAQFGEEGEVVDSRRMGLDLRLRDLEVLRQPVDAVGHLVTHRHRTDRCVLLDRQRDPAERVRQVDE